MYAPTFSIAARTPRLALAAAATLVLAACHDSTAPAKPTITALRIVSGNEQTTPAGSALAQPVVLQVTDQSQKPMAGVEVTVNVPYGDGTLGNAAPSVMTTDSNGEITIAWTVGTAIKPDTLVATVPEAVNSAGINTVAGVTVEEQVVAGAAAQIVVVSGDAQAGSVGSALAAPISVQVLDAYGNPVAGTTVTFSDDDNGSFANATLTTDSSGMATDQFTLGTAAGTDDVTASIAGANGPVQVTLHETVTQ